MVPHTGLTEVDVANVTVNLSKSHMWQRMAFLKIVTGVHGFETLSINKQRCQIWRKNLTQLNSVTLFGFYIVIILFSTQSDLNHFRIDYSLCSHHNLFIMIKTFYAQNSQTIISKVQNYRPLLIQQTVCRYLLFLVLGSVLRSSGFFF